MIVAFYVGLFYKTLLAEVLSKASSLTVMVKDYTGHDRSSRLKMNFKTAVFISFTLFA